MARVLVLVQNSGGSTCSHNQLVVWCALVLVWGRFILLEATQVPSTMHSLLRPAS